MARAKKSHSKRRGAAQLLDQLEAEANSFLTHYRRRELAQARPIAEDLIKQFPEEPFAWKALGSCLLEQGEAEAALSPLRRALELKPDDTESNTNIAKAFNRLGRYGEASQHIDAVLSIDPDNYQANMWMADVYSARDQHSLAIEHLERSIESTPEAVISRLRHASELVNKRDYKAALEILEALVVQAPRDPSVNGNLANLYGTMGRFSEAEQQYRKTINLIPNTPLPFSNYYFTAHYNPAHDAQALRDLALEWCQHYSPDSRPIRAETDRNAARQLHIGLISSGLRTHPVGQMITTVLENVPDYEISFHAYSDKLATDALAQRIQRAVSHWKDTGHLSDEDLAELIREDGIDILIDLSGHSAGNRLLAVAKEPAPLVVKWVGGLFNTTGLEAVDYLISDAIETPEGSDPYYLEKLIRMPDDYICYLQPPSAPPASGPLPALNNGYLTLGCFNNPAKINEPLLSEWAQLMKQLPESRLFLKGGQYTSADYCENIYKIMESHGISRDRLLLEGPASHTQLMRAYEKVDIALDTWPYSGGLTTCEAMLMGVPVVTLPGPTFAGRHSATHLINGGMPELVVDGWDTYRARVIELASDLESLSTIRSHLRDTLLQSPVCDAPRFARHFTTAMRAIWQRYCEGNAPEALTLNQEGEAQFEGEAKPVKILRAEPLREEKNGFNWAFKGKVIAVDNGGQLMRSTVVKQMLQLKTLELISFDPASSALDSPTKNQEGVHYYPNALLGNGEQRTFHACLDPALNATLTPLQTTGGAQVLTRLPVSSLKLDSIDGLPSVDWLVLDAMNDSTAILEHGAQALKDTLLIEAKVSFQPTHERQPKLAELTHWASRHRFRFYRLHEAQHRSHLPERDDLHQRQATELTSAGALLIPSKERLEALSGNQRMKLAFVLHTVYGIQDLTYKLLQVDGEKAESYLQAQGLVSSVADQAGVANHQTEASAPTVKQTRTLSVPDKPFMSTNEADLFLKSLKQASHYFEFGSGGSTVWAVEQGLTVHGVESDAKWVKALRTKLGERCQVKAVNIGPTREWGYPVSAAQGDKFPLYSHAINKHNIAFDLILVDGRFRVACTLAAIKHILSHHETPGTARIFIHDFWNRPAYHAVLNFLDSIENAESAGVFKVKSDIELKQLERVWDEYVGQPA